jgi:protein-disulfide isomerase
MKIFYGILAACIAVLIFLIGSTLWYSGAINRVNDAHVMGNPDGDLTVVEFLDYRCPFCQQMHPIISDAVTRDGNVRYIVRPVSSNDKDSLLAGALVYAAAAQGQFSAVHETLITDYRAITEEKIQKIAEDTGMDFEQYGQDILDPKMRDSVLKNNRLFLKSGGTGTPFFIMGNKMTYMPEDKMPTSDDLMALFNQARGL